MLSPARRIGYDAPEKATHGAGLDSDGKFSLEKLGYLFAAIFAAIMGGAILSLSKKAVDTMDPAWIGLCIALLAVLVIGAILTDPKRGS